MAVGSLLCMHFALVEQGGPDQPGIHPFARCGVANLVDSGLTGLCCFGGKLGMLFGQLLVWLSAGNPLSADDTGVGLIIGSAPTICSKLLLMGNR